MQSRDIQKILRWVEVAAWVGLIVHFSGPLYTSERTFVALQYWTSLVHLHPLFGTLLAINLILRKSAHILEFFLFGLLVYRALSGGTLIFRMGLAYWIIAGGATLALADEFHQIFVRGRTPALSDCGLDLSGVLASLLCVLMGTQIRKSSVGRRLTDSSG